MYDSCYTCPLSVYIDVTVDDRLERLAISGHPSREELEEARMRLVSEFSELSAASETAALAETAAAYYRRMTLIAGFETAFRLVSSGRFEGAAAFLNGNGVKCRAPASAEELESLVKRIRMKLMNHHAKLKEERRQYEALSAHGGKPTRSYYNRLLVSLSVCEAIKMQLNPAQMTVAEFAEYLNLFNEYQHQMKRNRLKIKGNGTV